MVDKAKIKLKKSKNIVIYAFRYLIYLVKLFIWKLKHDKKWTKYTKLVIKRVNTAASFTNKYLSAAFKPFDPYFNKVARFTNNNIIDPIKPYVSRFIKFLKKQIKKLISYLKANPKVAWGSAITIVVLAVGIPLLMLWLSIPKAPRLKTANNDYLYYAENQIYTAFIGSKENNTPTVQYRVNGSNVTFTPASGQPELAEPVRDGKTLTFRNVYQNIDYQYQTIAKGIKEEIIINEPSIIKQFPFYIDFEGAQPKYYTDNLAGGVFFDDKGEYIFHFEEPFAVDANGTRTDDVQLLLKRDKQSGRYVVVLGIDQKWAHADDRVYPIRIDPTVVHDESSEFSTGQLNRVKDVGAAPTYDNHTTSSQNSGTSMSFSHTVSGDNRVLLVALAYRAATNPTAEATSVTYNGDALTQLDRSQNTDRSTELWYLTAPDVGSNTVSITMSADPEAMVGTAVSYTGVNQVDPVGTAAGNTGSSTSPSVTVTTSGDETVVGVHSYYPNGGANSLSVDSPGTETWDVTSPDNNIGSSGAEQDASTTSTTINWTATQSFTWASSAVPLNPAANLETYYQELPADEHTVALWHLNDNVSGDAQTVSDSSGNGNDGTTNDGANNTGMDCTAPGQLDLGCDFDGNDDLITIPENFGIFDGSADFTLEAWINPDTTHNGRLVVSLQGERDWKFGVTSSGTFIFESYDTSAHTVSTNYKIEEWQHFVGVYSTTSGLSLYKNGELVDTNSWTGTPASQARQSAIGGENVTFAEYFDGTIDEVRISNISRTPEEIELAAQRRPYSIFTSDSIDLGTSVHTLDSLEWTELGVATGDGETVSDSTNLVAQWNFNETSGTSANNDAEGTSCGGTPSNCDGTLGGFSNTTGQDVAAGSGWTSDNRRWGAGALMFNGSSDYVSITDNASLAPSSQMSIESWFKFDSFTSGMAILNRRTTGNVGGYTLELSGTNGIRLHIYTSSWQNAYSGDNSLESGKWYHVVGTYDGSSIKIYLNGELAGSTSVTGSINNPASPTVWMGRNIPTNTIYFDGVIDSTRLYSDTLSSSEILSNYNAGQLEFQTRTSADNSTWETWKPTTNESQVLTFDSATDTNWDRTPGADPSGDVIKFTSTNVSAANAYTYQQTLDGTSTVATGDVVEYDVFTLNNIAEIGGLDIKYGDASYARQSGWTDQNSKPCHPGTDIASYVYDRWYHRTCTIDSTDNGKTIDFIDLVNEDDTGTSITAFYDNIVLKDSSGNIKEVFYERGATDYNTVDIRSDASNTADSSVTETHQPNPFETSSDTNIKIEGTGSYKSKVGVPKVTPSTEGLWHLDETNGDNAGDDVFDASAHGRDGEFFGTNIASSVVEGISSKARTFNGSDDYIEITGYTGIGGTGARSVEVWIKTTSSTDQAIVSWGEDTTGNKYIVRVDSTNGNVLRVEVNGGYEYGSTNLADGNWHHIAVVLPSGSTNVTQHQLFVDGVEESVTNLSQTMNTSTTRNVQIGQDHSNRYFNGQIDEVRISSAALSANEVFESYRMGKNHRLTRTVSNLDLSSSSKAPFYVAADRPGTYLETTAGETAFTNYEPDANTLAFYHLEEEAGSGAYIKDYSGNGYHATPTDSPTLVKGKFGKGRNMPDNSNARLEPSTDIPLGSSWTVDTWFYSPLNDTSTWRTLTRGQAGDHQIIVETGAYRLGTYDNTGATGFKPCSPTYNVNSLSDGWHYLAVVQDGTNMNFYIDGQYTCQVAGYTSTTDIGAIGNYLTGTQPWGAIDEFRVSDTARTAEEIRQAYEVGARSHQVTIDFGASLDSGNLITGSGDTSFIVDATAYGLSEKGSMLFEGDKIIVRENYDGTEYIAQGDVTTITASTGVVTIDAWDSGSTFPSSGFTANATVFKWQREYWDITEPLDSHLNAITKITLRVTNGNEGRTIWLDDMKSSSDYMTTEGGSTISSTAQRYFQYRAILSSYDTNVSPSFTNTTLTYTENAVPGSSSLEANYLHDKLKTSDTTPEIRFSATDSDGDDLSYQVQWDTDSSFPSPSSAVSDTNPGFTDVTNGADTDPFASGDTISYTFQSALSDGTTYYYRVRAKDPAGSNTYGSYSSIRSFTVDTSLGDINGWFETEEDQFTTDTLGGNAQVNASGHVEVTATTGTVTSTAITATNIDSSQVAWGQLLFTDDETFGDIKYKLYYDVAGTPTIIPDVDLAGNSTGFDTSGVDLTGLSTSTYSILYLYAELTYSGGSPQLQDWTATMNITPNTPTANSPTGGTLTTTTPSFTLTATDDDGDNIQYKIKLCEDMALTTNCQTFDQSQSQTGWSNQDADGGTTYASGSQGTYLVQSALTEGTTYYWEGSATDPSGTNIFGTTSSVESFTVNSSPTAPTELLTEGESEPLFVTDSTPEFSALCNDPDSGQILNKYQIQVDDNLDFATPVWDSGSSGTTMTDCTAGNRSQDISFGGTPLSFDTSSYYWRIKFWDALGAEGTFSNESTFRMSDGSPTQCTVQETVDDSSLTLNWSDNTDYETQFRIERNVNAAGFTLLTNAAADSTSHQDTDVSAGNTYQYRVRAEDGTVSSWCTTDTFTLSTGTFQFEGLNMQGLDLE